MLKEIEKLKEKINKLKDRLENPNYISPIISHPTPLVKIFCYKKYLDLAIKIFKDSGGNYIYSKEELESIKFNENIKYISEIYFYIGGYFSAGYDNFLLSIDKKTSSVIIKNGYNRLNSLDFLFKNSLNYEKFKNDISSLNMGEWKDNYDNIYVLDGIQWNIKIKYSNKIKPIQFSGSNSYPYNFYKFKEIFSNHYEGIIYEF